MDTLKKVLASAASSSSSLSAASADSSGSGPSLVVNPALITEARERLLKAEKDLKALDAKDATDKLAAIEIATKAAKKLKKGKGKGKGKKDKE